MGGGRRNLLPKNDGGRRRDDRNLINVWLNDKKQRGLEAKFVSNIEMLREFDSDKVDYLLGIIILFYVNDESNHYLIRKTFHLYFDLIIIFFLKKWNR